MRKTRVNHIQQSMRLNSLVSRTLLLKIYTHELQAANVMAIDYVADLFGHMPLTTQKTAGNDK